MNSELQPGSLFANDFKIVRPLDEGGMGSVYIAEQQSTGNQRALKLMLPSLVSDAKLRERFLLEARIGSRIESDHVVQVIAAGIEPGQNVPWLAMELLHGEELEQRVRREGPLPRHVALEVTRQLCHALSAAHAVGVVHRDLKPKNLFLCKPRISGAPFLLKVLDFGIAKVMAEALTTGTAGMGTPLWMAPEQTEISSHVGPETDLWALGLLVYWMLTGKPYWLGAQQDATNVQIILRELVMDPLPPASERARACGVGHLVPQGFDAWLARCLERARAARYASADLALADLGRVLSTEAVVRPTPILDEFTTRPTYADGLEPIAPRGPGLPAQLASAPQPDWRAPTAYAHSQAYAPNPAPQQYGAYAPRPQQAAAGPGTMQPVIVQPAAPAAVVRANPSARPTKNLGVLIGAATAFAALIGVGIYFIARDDKPKISRDYGRDLDDPTPVTVPRVSKADECRSLYGILKETQEEVSSNGLDPAAYVRTMDHIADRIQAVHVTAADLVGPTSAYVAAQRDQASAARRATKAAQEGRFDDPAAAEVLAANGRVSTAYGRLVDACGWSANPPLPDTPGPGAPPPPGLE
ncbi:MAG: serine/threonine-protein kinase [Polyangiaceae bacterium]